jgi:hypothetical protein
MLYYVLRLPGVGRYCCTACMFAPQPPIISCTSEGERPVSLTALLCERTNKIAFSVASLIMFVPSLSWQTESDFCLSKCPNKNAFETFLLRLLLTCRSRSGRLGSSCHQCTSPRYRDCQCPPALRCTLRPATFAAIRSGDRTDTLKTALFVFRVGSESLEFPIIKKNALPRQARDKQMQNGATRSRFPYPRRAPARSRTPDRSIGSGPASLHSKNAQNGPFCH